MDIELLSKMVKELVQDHDSVELPGFGTFVAIRMPASFSDRGYTINPPYRKLNFLRGNHPSDGLLTDLYAASNSIEKSDADSIIRRFLLELKDVLDQEKMLVFPSLGVIKTARNNVSLFVPDADLDISPEYYGLAPISMKSSVKVTNAKPIVLSTSSDTTKTEPFQNEPDQTFPKQEQTFENKNETEVPVTNGIEHTVRKKSSRWWLIPVFILIALCVLLGIFLALAHFAPDIIDKFLYSEEELQIIHTDLEKLLLN